MNDSPNSSKCATCDKVINLRAHNDYFPFCSDHCRQVDLGRWFDGSYSLHSPSDNLSDQELASQLKN